MRIINTSRQEKKRQQNKNKQRQKSGYSKKQVKLIQNDVRL